VEISHCSGISHTKLAQAKCFDGRRHSPLEFFGLSCREQFERGSCNSYISRPELRNTLTGNQLTVSAGQGTACKSFHCNLFGIQKGKRTRVLVASVILATQEAEIRRITV
jgi:hypothetical protein